MRMVFVLMTVAAATAALCMVIVRQHWTLRDGHVIAAGRPRLRNLFFEATIVMVFWMHVAIVTGLLQCVVLVIRLAAVELLQPMVD